MIAAIVLAACAMAAIPACLYVGAWIFAVADRRDWPVLGAVGFSLFFLAAFAMWPLTRCLTSDES